MQLRGKIIATCGHEIPGHDGAEYISTGEEVCDAVDGFVKAVVTGVYCKVCAAERKTWPNYLPDEEAEDAWMDSGRRDIPVEQG